jgi:hypothetical protein
MMSDDEVKELLGRAFGQEPPLRIDRDKVFHQGRKRLRRRRMFEAGSVVAAVMVAAVGAATLTDLAADQERTPPAASSTAAPTSQPGPSLPLTTPPPTTTRTTESPASSTPGPPSAEIAGQAPKMSGAHAIALTQLLYEAEVVSRAEVEPTSADTGEPTFQIRGNAYVYETDVVGRGAPGFLQVVVDHAPGTEAGCNAVPVTFGNCETTGKYGEQVALAWWKGANGERRYFAMTAFSDGTRVAALSSNMTRAERAAGNTTVRDAPPVLSKDELARLIVKSGLSVR